MLRLWVALGCLGYLVACQRQGAPVSQAKASAKPGAAARRTPAKRTAATKGKAAAKRTAATKGKAPGRRRAPALRSPAFTPAQAAGVLYAPKASKKALASLQRCASKGGQKAQIRCMLKRRYARDRRARKEALAIYAQSGGLAGVERRYTMAGGWRGKVRIVPHLPLGRRRYHLRWLRASLADYQRFFAGLSKRAKKPFGYRWRHIAFKFFRSVGKRTPSAYAWKWQIAYNVQGSLMGSASGVRETLFHEIFHLNDEHMGDWSSRALKPLYQRIVRRCTRKRGKQKKLDNRCLKPYAPHSTIIRRLGVYYAFHSESGVVEYAAELAIRYYREHRAILRKGRSYAPFKCRTKANAAAWKKLADAFFGGVDLTRPCKNRRRR